MSLLSCLIPLSLCNKFVRNIFINKMHVLNKDFIHGSYFFPYIFIPYGSFIYLFIYVRKRRTYSIELLCSKCFFKKIK